MIFTLFSSLECDIDYAKRIEDRFYDKRTECFNRNNAKKPAYQCSGILIRGVKDGHSPAWRMKPGNAQRTSFSVAFLREDTPFDSMPFNYNTGFIIYPHLSTPKKKNSYRVYCSLVVDGWTDGREGRHGCGKSQSDTTGTSRHCDAQGITSFNKWKTHYNSIMTGPNVSLEPKQCAFDMTLSTAARDFSIMLKAKTFLRSKNDKYSYINNELLFHIWTAERPKKLPIEAFFYLIDSQGALDQAKKHQAEYLQRTGEKRPIVGIRLPSAANPRITITNAG